MYHEVDITGMFQEWIHLHGIYLWQKKYVNVKNSAAKLMVIVEYIYGLKGTVFTAIQKQY